MISNITYDKESEKQNQLRKEIIAQALREEKEERKKEK